MTVSRGIYLAYFFQGLIATNGIYAFIAGRYAEMFTAILMFGLTFVPYIVAERYDIRFPWFLFMLIALSLWIHTAGYIHNYYVTFYPYYDKVAHLISGISVALIGFLGVIFLDRYWRMNLTPLFVIGFTLIFGMALGAIWEIYEFLVDMVFRGSLAGPMQNDLYDTMIDMIFVLIGSAAVAILGVVYFQWLSVDDIADSLDAQSDGPDEAA